MTKYNVPPARAPRGYHIKSNDDGSSHEAYANDGNEYLGTYTTMWRAVQVCRDHKARQDAKAKEETK